MRAAGGTRDTRAEGVGVYGGMYARQGVGVYGGMYARQGVGVYGGMYARHARRELAASAAALTG